jgi:hypothetical protein
MSTLKCRIEAGCHTSGESFRGRATKLGKSLGFRGRLPVQAEYFHHIKINRKQNILGPSIRQLRIRKGWSQAALSMRLKMAGWHCSRSRLAKIECGLITVWDYDLPHFLRVFATNIEALYHAEIFRH